MFDTENPTIFHKISLPISNYVIKTQKIFESLNIYKNEENMSSLVVGIMTADGIECALMSLVWNCEFE